jgi:hypothetical protein
MAHSLQQWPRSTFPRCWLPQKFTPAAWEKFQQGFGTLRHTLTTAGVDTIVVISDEHFNALIALLSIVWCGDCRHLHWSRRKLAWYTARQYYRARRPRPG